jgi:putative thioredoxin
MSPAAPRRPAAPSPALTAAMTGAVDLAAVKARSEAAARAAEAPAPAAGQYVIDVTEASFQAEVLDRSFQVPVLLDLWATWCEPCKQLSPVLEKLATEAAGQWILAKIDVDANQRLAQALQVQGIPAVFAVIGGQILSGFQGALPEPQVREFVAAVLQAAQQAGLSGAGAPAETEDGEQAQPQQPEDPRFDAAESALADGDYVRAAERFQAIVDAEPNNAAAAQGLKQAQLLERVSTLDPAVASRADADPADVAAQLGAADLAFAGDDVDGALRRLLETLTRTSGDERDAVRQRLIDYFDLLGPDDPRVGPARREMARALF